MSSLHRLQVSPSGHNAEIVLNRMDNIGFEQDRRTTVEMGQVQSPASPVVTPTAINGNGVPGCTDVCLSLHQQHQRNLQQHQKSTAPGPSESPWHRLKTIFLVSAIGSLIIWVVVYTVLSQMAYV